MLRRSTQERIHACPSSHTVVFSQEERERNRRGEEEYKPVLEEMREED